MARYRVLANVAGLRHGETVDLSGWDDDTVARLVRRGRIEAVADDVDAERGVVQGVVAPDPYDSLTKSDLVEAARARGLPVSGTREDLIAPLRDDDTDVEPESDEPEPEPDDNQWNFP